MITTLRLKLLIVKQTPAFQHLREDIENSKENMIAKGLVIIYVEARWGGGGGKGKVGGGRGKGEGGGGRGKGEGGGGGGKGRGSRLFQIG